MVRAGQPVQEGLPLPGTRMTAAEFEALPETTILIELIDGKVHYPHLREGDNMPTPRSLHQITLGQIYRTLFRLVPNGLVIMAPMDVRLGTDIVQPDLFWVTEGGACTDKDTFFDGPPYLVVEILSPGNMRHDRVTKFDLYQRSGVSEYWIVDADERFLEVNHLRDGRYVRVAVVDGMFESPVLEQAVILSELFPQN
jgi:Uma2 family endonuclease